MYHYYSSPDDPNRISFAGEYTNGILKIAAARTSTKDRFIRRIGRAKAVGRLKGDILLSEQTIDDFSIRKFVDRCNTLISYIHKDPFIVSFKPC